MFPKEQIRNYSIIAHVDHGKSTLADRILEFTGTISQRDMVDQVLDQMELERERGITIKMQPVRIKYKADDGLEYQLNLIDTPGHVDFSYEVSRSLAACEGAILVVDASQGIEAQTLANLYQAIEHDLVIIPVVNKIDLEQARPEQVRQDLVALLGCAPDDVIMASAKLGIGIKEILEAVVKRIPPPTGSLEAPLRALIFDAHFDSYKGVIVHLRVFDGSIKTGDQIQLMATGAVHDVTETGYFSPWLVPTDGLYTGEVGYITANIREVSQARVGDTVTYFLNPAADPLPGYRPAKPMVFAGMFPVDPGGYEDLKEALEKLKLNDAALSYEPEVSTALGFGFRCGFLGLLHMDIVQERLEREFGLNLITTAPSVEYKAVLRNGEAVYFRNPDAMPDISKIDYIEEPFVKATIFVPEEYVGAVMELCHDRRAEFISMSYELKERVQLVYHLPLAELITDFYDRLKSLTRGYASLDYEHIGYKRSDLVKVDILVAGNKVDALSCIIHRDVAEARGRKIISMLRGLIPRQLFEVSLQAAIGSKIIARENIPPLRKDVLAKCYGGDVTRKRKLLEKQKEGKKRLKRIGNVDIPQEAFMSILKQT
jgi:GTP-binding protein LepA